MHLHIKMLHIHVSVYNGRFWKYSLGYGWLAGYPVIASHIWLRFLYSGQ